MKQHRLVKGFLLNHISRAKAKSWVQEQKCGLSKSTVSGEERMLKSGGRAGAQPCFARAYNHEEDCNSHSRQSAHPHVCLAGPAAGLTPPLSVRRGCTPAAATCSQSHLEPERHREHFKCMPANPIFAARGPPEQHRETRSSTLQSEDKGQAGQHTGARAHGQPTQGPGLQGLTVCYTKSLCPR